MPGNTHVDHESHGQSGLAEPKDKIKDVLAELPLDILIYLFTSKNPQDPFIQSLEQSRIPTLWNTEVREIRWQEKAEVLELYNTETKESSILKVDGVFIAVGYTPNTVLVQKLGVQLTPDGYIRRDERHRTNIPGIYSAGDAEGGYKQIITAAGQGAGAAMTI